MSHTTSIRLDKLTRNKKRFERYKNDVHLFKFLNNYFCILYINIFAYQSIFFFSKPRDVQDIIHGTRNTQAGNNLTKEVFDRSYCFSTFVHFFHVQYRYQPLLSLPSWKGTTCIPKRIGDERRKFPLSKQ